MSKLENTRDEASIAADLLNYTGRSLFLTGKAGTGKTTFLHRFLAQTNKKAVVVAPTGVAAINAGGMTIHSLFQFPPGLFVPANAGAYGQENVFNKNTLAKSIFLSATKRKLISSLELLVIDEVSMLRADLLDAMDTMLRSVRRNYHEPMGGVQVLYIGDLWQLPPVVKEQDWAVLSGYYNGPFFFDSKVIEEQPPVVIELTKIYRQEDEQFIHLLNNIRNNTLEKDDYYELNKRFQPDEIDYDRDDYVILTSHNFKANQINEQKMRQLDSEPFTFSSSIKGDFNENTYPTETELTLKVGAQVMFLKNDSEEKKRYYNGKLAKINGIRKNKDDETEITVVFKDGIEMQLEKETWNNLRFEYNQEEDKVDEKILGTFTQYPIKPAWAITIHKSQGLTFDEVVIDAGRAFAPGQVYVALSRCRTLNGITLLSEITSEAIKTDERVIQFTGNSITSEELENLLANERVAFEQQLLLDLFRLNGVKELAYHMQDIYKDRKPNPSLEIPQFVEKIKKTSMELIAVAEKFRNELISLFRQPEHLTRVQDRVEKAVPYFTKILITEVLNAIVTMDVVLSKAKKVKSIHTKLAEFEVAAKQQINKLQHIIYLGQTIYQKTDLDTSELRGKMAKENDALAEKKAQTANLSSADITLSLLKEKKSVKEVAEERGLAESTIFGHAAQLIKEEKIKVAQVIDKEKIKDITEVIKSFSDTPNVGDIRLKLGDKYTYSEYACVLNSLS